jgi:hypothetical protein
MAVNSELFHRVDALTRIAQQTETSPLDRYSLNSRHPLRNTSVRLVLEANMADGGWHHPLGLHVKARQTSMF